MHMEVFGLALAIPAVLIANLSNRNAVRIPAAATFGCWWRIPNCAANTISEFATAVIRPESVSPPGFTQALPTRWNSIGRPLARFGLAQEHPSHPRHAAIGV
jgi:hypothetical protein